MARETRSPARVVPRLVAVGVVALLLTATVAGPTAAAPRLFVSGATKDASTILAGETVNVTATVKNTGEDGGGMGIEFKVNGTTTATDRVVVDADSSNTSTKPIRLSKPGTYRLTVTSPERSAGRVQVKRAIAEIAREDAGSRAIRVRGGSVPTSSPYTVDMPADTNRSFTVQSWTVDASQRSFTQSVSEYTDPQASGLPIPSDDAAAVFSAVTVGSTDGVQPSSMQFALNRSQLRNAGMDADEVRVYQRVNESWRATETTVVAEQPSRVIYEADTSGSTAFVVGKIGPSFSIARTSVVSEQVPTGQRVVVEGVVRNTGSIEGTYDAQMRIDDEVVNETSARIPANSERTVGLSTVVTTPGRYQVAFNDAGAGVIQVSESQVQTDGNGGAEPTGTATGTDAAATEPGIGDGDGDSGAGPLPGTVMGINTLFVVGGLVAALLLFGVIIALLRRAGGGRNNSGFEL